MKYRNRHTTIDGMRFASKAEGRRYQELKLLERAGKISDLLTQVSYKLAPPVKFAGTTRNKPALRYIADFRYVEDGVTIVEDVKSPASITEAFQIKRHLMLSTHGIDIRITK